MNPNELAYASNHVSRENIISNIFWVGAVMQGQFESRPGRAMMSERKKQRSHESTATRRQVIVGGAIALGGLAFGSSLHGQKHQTMKEEPSMGAERTRTFLHQEVDFKASIQRIYDALLDSKQFAAFTGASAEISREVGGAFSTFGGLIVGRNIELIPNQRIVQAWRPKNWDPGVYSIVKFELKEYASQTKVVLDRTGFPEGSFGHLDLGWNQRYWEPLKKFLA